MTLLSLPIVQIVALMMPSPMSFTPLSLTWIKGRPTKLATKLKTLGLGPSLCSWTPNFLSHIPQTVNFGLCTSNIITLGTGAPQGCILSPLLYFLYTHNCIPTHSSNSIVKFADVTVVVGFISDNDETTYYFNKVEVLSSWCKEN